MGYNYGRVYNKKESRRGQYRKRARRPSGRIKYLIGFIIAACVVAVLCIVMLSGTTAPGKQNIAQATASLKVIQSPNLNK
jgi:hypothetical protein